MCGLVLHAGCRRGLRSHPGRSDQEVISYIIHYRAKKQQLTWAFRREGGKGRLMMGEQFCLGSSRASGDEQRMKLISEAATSPNADMVCSSSSAVTDLTRSETSLESQHSSLVKPRLETRSNILHCSELLRFHTEVEALLGLEMKNMVIGQERTLKGMTIEI